MRGLVYRLPMPIPYRGLGKTAIAVALPEDYGPFRPFGNPFQGCGP